MSLCLSDLSWLLVYHSERKKGDTIDFMASLNLLIWCILNWDKYSVIVTRETFDTEQTERLYANGSVLQHSFPIS